MTGRRTNLALLAAVALALVSGTLAFAAGAPPWAGAVVVAHGVLGTALLVLAWPKSRVIRSGWRVQRPTRWLSVALAVVVVLTVVTGFAHTLAWEPFGEIVSAMQLHVPAAIATGLLVTWHAMARPARPRRTDLSRRAALQTGGVLGLAGLGWLTWQGTGAAERRFTGSHEVGSGDPRAMPVTQWFTDDVPHVDADAWRLDVVGRRLGLRDLVAFDDRVIATIDCTNGWYARQTWTGARLERLLPRPGDGARSVVVASVTGYRRRFPLADVSTLLLATHVAGVPLSPGHGAPARLVAPGRRGFWWVKWVATISFDTRPAWAQSPFPLR